MLNGSLCFLVASNDGKHATRVWVAAMQVAAAPPAVAPQREILLPAPLLRPVVAMAAAPLHPALQRLEV